MKGYTEEDWMRLALQEARKGIGKTSPNPAVGAVIIKNGQLLSKGWHRRAGLLHAEIEAIQALPDPAQANGSTIFITLEPCSTYGRTPPCVDTIVRNGFKRVVVGTMDPNPAHAGRGIGILREAGIVVIIGVLEKECRQLNEAFNKWIVTKRPLVIAKCAMSLDGRITRKPGESQWITTEKARKHVHQLRSSVDAIMVGAETVRRDNPQLTIRGLGKRAAQRQPWRVVISRSGRLPSDSALLIDLWKNRTLIFDDLAKALTELGKRQLTSILIEGGGELLGSAFDQNLVDRVAFFFAPNLVGGDKSAVAGLGVDANKNAIHLEDFCYEKMGSELFCEARVKKV